MGHLWPTFLKMVSHADQYNHKQASRVYVKSWSTAPRAQRGDQRDTAMRGSAYVGTSASKQMIQMQRRIMCQLVCCKGDTLGSCTRSSDDAASPAILGHARAIALQGDHRAALQRIGCPSPATNI